MSNKKQRYESAPSVIEEVAVDNTVACEEPEVIQDEITVSQVKTGVVTDCVRLNVRNEPSSVGRVLVVLKANTELAVYEQESTTDFYKVCTPAGIEGYVVKQFISIQ